MESSPRTFCVGAEGQALFTFCLGLGRGDSWGGCRPCVLLQRRLRERYLLVEEKRWREETKAVVKAFQMQVLKIADFPTYVLLILSAASILKQVLFYLVI